VAAGGGGGGRAGGGRGSWVAGRWYCRRTAEGGEGGWVSGWVGGWVGGGRERGAEGRVGQGRRCRRGGSLRRKDEKRGKNIRKARERDKDDARKERKGVGWLALVFEFKYQTVREEPSGPQEPLQPENPRDSDTVFARN